MIPILFRFYLNYAWIYNCFSWFQVYAQLLCLNLLSI